MTPKSIRKLRGKLTRESAAKRARISYRTIESWEQGTRKPNRLFLAHYREALK